MWLLIIVKKWKTRGALMLVRLILRREMYRVNCMILGGAPEYFIEDEHGNRKGSFDCERQAQFYADYENRRANERTTGERPDKRVKRRKKQDAP